MYYIAVIGAATCDDETAALAEKVGEEIARRGAVLICGGRGGVMEAASRGAAAKGGLVLGILPGNDPRQGNRYLSAAVATGLGDARNAVIACTADAIIAVGGEYGTLSEIGHGLKMGKPVIGLQTWRLQHPREMPVKLVYAATPAQAVELAWGAIKRCP